MELAWIGRLSGRKDGTQPGYDWSLPSRIGRPCRHNISAGIFLQSAAYQPGATPRRHRPVFFLGCFDNRPCCDFLRRSFLPPREFKIVAVASGGAGCLPAKLRDRQTLGRASQIQLWLAARPIVQLERGRRSAGDATPARGGARCLPAKLEHSANPGRGRQIQLRLPTRSIIQLQQGMQCAK